MAYPALKVINDAYFLSQIAMKEGQTLAGLQAEEGLQYLNQLIALKSASTRKIPYYTLYNLTGIEGDEVYFIPGLLLAETFTFEISTVRVSTTQLSRRPYFGDSRANNVNSLPMNWHLERALVDGVDGSNLYLYFPPDQEYPLQLMGKFAFSQVATVNDDLSLTFPLYYITFLQFELAEFICLNYGMSVPPNVKEYLGNMAKDMVDQSAPDLSLNLISLYPSRPIFSFAQANIGKAFTPY